MGKFRLRYTVVYHNIREDVVMDLDGNQYFVVEAIDRLSRSKRAPLEGWCTTAKKDIADFICLGERTVERIVSKLIIRGIAIKHPDEKKYPGALRIVPEFRELVEKYRNMSEGDWDELAALGKVFEGVRQSGGGVSVKVAEGVPPDCRGESANVAVPYDSNNSKGYSNNKNNGLFCFSDKNVVYDFDRLWNHYVRHEDEEAFREWYGKNVLERKLYLRLWKAFTNYKNSSEGAKFPKKIMNFMKVWEKDWSY